MAELQKIILIKMAEEIVREAILNRYSFATVKFIATAPGEGWIMFNEAAERDYVGAIKEV